MTSSGSTSRQSQGTGGGTPTNFSIKVVLRPPSSESSSIAVDRITINDNSQTSLQQQQQIRRFSLNEILLQRTCNGRKTTVVSLKKLLILLKNVSVSSSTNNNNNHAPKSTPYKATMKQDGQSSISMQTISAMPQYENKSLEELRYEDYLQGNKGTGSATGGGGFGAGAFGASENVPLTTTTTTTITKFTYRDDDGDVITITTDQELVSAIKLFAANNKRSIKLVAVSDAADASRDKNSNDNSLKKVSSPTPQSVPTSSTTAATKNNKNKSNTSSAGVMAFGDSSLFHTHKFSIGTSPPKRRRHTIRCRVGRCVCDRYPCVRKKSIPAKKEPRNVSGVDALLADLHKSEQATQETLKECDELVQLLEGALKKHPGRKSTLATPAPKPDEAASIDSEPAATSAASSMATITDIQQGTKEAEEEDCEDDAGIEKLQAEMDEIHCLTANNINTTNDPCDADDAGIEKLQAEMDEIDRLAANTTNDPCDADDADDVLDGEEGDVFDGFTELQGNIKRLKAKMDEIGSHMKRLVPRGGSPHERITPSLAADSQEPIVLDVDTPEDSQPASEDTQEEESSKKEIVVDAQVSEDAKGDDMVNEETLAEEPHEPAEPSNQPKENKEGESKEVREDTEEPETQDAQEHAPTNNESETQDTATAVNEETEAMETQNSYGGTPATTPAHRSTHILKRHGINLPFNENDNDTDDSFSPNFLEIIPPECFNNICLYIPISDLIQKISVCSKALNDRTSQNNDPLWNLLLCHRLWTVDPCVIIGKTLISSSKLKGQQQQRDTEGKEAKTKNSHHHPINSIHCWRDRYKAMVIAEKRHEQYLQDLKQIDLEGWLERHFIGQLAPQWNGWERRYWSWSSSNNTFAAWADEMKRHCYAQFPLRADSQVRRVYPEEQIDLTTTATTTSSTKLNNNNNNNNPNPVTDTKPYVFTVTNTTFDILWSCHSEEQLQLWLDKINVTLHPLKFGGTYYKAPAKYLLQNNNKNTTK